MSEINDMLIMENFLTPRLNYEIQKIIANPHFDWKYSQSSVATPTMMGDWEDEHFFIHPFVRDGEDLDSKEYNIIGLPLLLALELKTNFLDPNIRTFKVNRSKVNMYLKSPNTKQHTPHVDREYDDNDKARTQSWSLLYYVDETDGDTVFYNEHWTHDIKYEEFALTEYKRVSPKANTAILFKSNRFHSSSSPSEHLRRINVNIVLDIIRQTKNVDS
jgi:hypothetical protein